MVEVILRPAKWNNSLVDWSYKDSSENIWKIGSFFFYFKKEVGFIYSVSYSKQSNYISNTESFSSNAWEQYRSHFLLTLFARWENTWNTQKAMFRAQRCSLFFPLIGKWLPPLTVPIKSDSAAAMPATSATLWQTITFHISYLSLSAVFKGTLHQVLLFHSILSR